jgi:hypothetical protein
VEVKECGGGDGEGKSLLSEWDAQNCVIYVALGPGVRAHMSREVEGSHHLPWEQIKERTSSRERITEASSGSAGIKARSTEETTSHLNRLDRVYSETVVPRIRGSVKLPLRECILL